MANTVFESIASNLALACQRVVAAEKFARVMCIARQIGEPVDIPETEIYRLWKRIRVISRWEYDVYKFKPQDYGTEPSSL